MKQWCKSCNSHGSNIVKWFTSFASPGLAIKIGMRLVTPDGLATPDVRDTSSPMH